MILKCRQGEGTVFRKFLCTPPPFTFPLFFFVYMVITKHSDGAAEGCNVDMSGSLVYINNGSNFIRTAAEPFSYPRWRSHVI